MPLYIRDDAVDRLTEEVMHATGAKNKTEAVRMALQAQLKAARAKAPLLEAVNEMRSAADEIGPRRSRLRSEGIRRFPMG